MTYQSGWPIGLINFLFSIDPYRDTFLSAAYSNDTATIKKLLATGIDPNYSDSKGRTGEPAPGEVELWLRKRSTPLIPPASFFSTSHNFV